MLPLGLPLALLPPRISISSIALMSSTSPRERGSIEKRSIAEDEKWHHATAETKEVDAAAQLSTQGEVDPAEALRIRYDIVLVQIVELRFSSSLLGVRSTNISSP